MRIFCACMISLASIAKKRASKYINVKIALIQFRMSKAPMLRFLSLFLVVIALISPVLTIGTPSPTNLILPSVNDTTTLSKPLGRWACYRSPNFSVRRASYADCLAVLREFPDDYEPPWKQSVGSVCGLLSLGNGLSYSTYFSALERLFFHRFL